MEPEALVSLGKGHYKEDFPYFSILLRSEAASKLVV